MKWFLALAGAAAGALCTAALGDTVDLATRPSIVSQLDTPTRALVVLVVFGLFAYAWYSFHLSMARAKHGNFHAVDRATLDRLAAQERGDDPPALDDESLPIGNQRTQEVTR